MIYLVSAWLATVHFFIYARAKFIWPSPLVEELDHLLVDTSGYNSAGFADGVTPCSLYVQGPQTLGRQTAGQWMRIGFHDFVTANIKAGTGGMDASIGFETLREENSGSAMNDSLSFFLPFVNKYASSSYLSRLNYRLLSLV